jgi:hypothetical protein
MSSSSEFSFKNWFYDGLDAENHEAGHVVAFAHHAPNWFKMAYVFYNRDKRGWDGGVIPRDDVAPPDRPRLLLIAVMGCLAEGKRNASDRIDQACLLEASGEIHDCVQKKIDGIRVEIKLVDGRIRLPIITSADFQFIEDPTKEEIHGALVEACDFLDQCAYWGQVHDVADLLSRDPHQIDELPTWCFA